MFLSELKDDGQLLLTFKSFILDLEDQRKITLYKTLVGPKRKLAGQ